MKFTQYPHRFISLKSGRGKHFTVSVLMLAILMSSLILLIAVGLGEAYRTYPQLEIDRLILQAETVKSSMLPFLLAGLSLKQFPGLLSLTKPLLESDKSIAAIYISDPDGNIIFENFPSELNGFDPKIANGFRPSKKADDDKTYDITENKHFYRVSIVLENKFETVGRLHITMPKLVISRKIMSAFSLPEIDSIHKKVSVFKLLKSVNLPIYAGIIVCLAFLLFWVSGKRPARSRRRWLAVSFGASYLMMMFIVILTLINLFNSGIQGKTRTLAQSLGHRLNAPLELGLGLGDFVGIDRLLKKYKELNPELSFIALIRDNKILIHTDDSLNGKRWISPSGQYEFGFQLRGKAISSLQENRLPPDLPIPSNIEDLISLKVGVPKSVVVAKLWRSVKNFFALFIACALLAIVFFSLIEFFAEKNLRDPQLLQEYNLRLIRVLYFTGVFVDGLTKSFLPQYFHGLAIEAQFGLKSVSTLFTIFFAAYSIALVPAGWTVERKGAKPVLVCGVVLILAGQLTMTLIPDIYAMFIAQGLSGFGHGIFFIGIQSYILSIVSGAQRVRGIAIIVFGYNGGILAGAPVGALLAAYMSPRNVFLAGASLSLLLLIYIIKLIQKASVAKFEHRGTVSRLSPLPGMLQGLGKVIKDFKFMKTVVFIAIPTKIIMAGFISVSLPLILARHNYKTDDIGQIIIFYFAGVLFTSRYISKQADRLGKTYNILFLGALCSGVGLILFGLMDVAAMQLPGQADTGIIFALAGMIAIGCGHGFIQAPVISYITDTRVADTLGQSTTTSFYRLFERFGNIGGPIVIGLLLSVNNYKAVTITWIGIAVIIFAFLFYPNFKRRKQQNHNQKV